MLTWYVLHTVRASPVQQNSGIMERTVRCTVVALAVLAVEKAYVIVLIVYTMMNESFYAPMFPSHCPALPCPALTRNTSFESKLITQFYLFYPFLALFFSVTNYLYCPHPRIPHTHTHTHQSSQVLGMHGAALAHAVFSRRGVVTVELKTLYGYSSMVFALVSDSRLGLHGQVRTLHCIKDLRGGSRTLFRIVLYMVD
jgi:hypothetical protein